MVDLLIFISTLLLGVLMTLVGLEMAGDKNVVERKRRYRWIFGCLGVAFMILSIFQFVRSDGAAKRAEQERHAAELRNEGNFKYQQGQLDMTNKILAEMAKNSDPKQIATALANALPKTTPSPGSSGVQPPALERMTDRQLREKVIEFANDVRKFVKQWHDREITVSRDFENREMNAKDDAERHQIREEETSSYLYRTNQIRSEWSSQFKASAITYKDEMVRRLGPQRQAGSARELAALDSDFVNLTFLDNTAAYLEGLANKLPH